LTGKRLSRAGFRKIVLPYCIVFRYLLGSDSDEQFLADFEENG
jgi:hypothetical protein